MSMKRLSFVGLGVLAAIATVPLISGTPVLAGLQDLGESIVQQIRRPDVKLVMSADKQVTVVDEKGESKLEWQALEGEVTVHPGDVLRYTVQSENEGEMSAKNLMITQPIPPQMTYVLDSAAGNKSAKVTYSIDNGETFVEQPMVEVTLPDGTVEMQPAPAEAYTQIRWSFADSLDPTVAVDVNYQVKVQ